MPKRVVKKDFVRNDTGVFDAKLLPFLLGPDRLTEIGAGQMRARRVVSAPLGQLLYAGVVQEEVFKLRVLKLATRGDGIVEMTWNNGCWNQHGDEEDEDQCAYRGICESPPTSSSTNRRWSPALPTRFS